MSLEFHKDSSGLSDNIAITDERRFHKPQIYLIYQFPDPTMQTEVFDIFSGVINLVYQLTKSF